jgi:chromosome segregation ATPase
LSTNLNSAQEQLVVALDKLQIALGNDAADAETVAKAQNELFAVKAEIAKKSAEIELKDTEINNLKTANEVVVSQVDAINEELNQLESEINEESTKLETFIVPTLESTLSESEPATEIIAENTVIS